jgi:hypothetical protein
MTDFHLSVLFADDKICNLESSMNFGQWAGEFREFGQDYYKLVTQKENLITPGIKTSSSNTFQKPQNIIKFSFM